MRSRATSWTYLLLVAAVPILMSIEQTRAGEAQPQAVIILDSSGSMGGAIPGQKEIKWATARDAIVKALPDLVGEARVGLMTFGSRAGSCGEINLAVPPAPGSGGLLPDSLAKLGPNRRGPIALALREAARALDPTSRGSIILIHDDNDNCGGDVCEAAATIARSNPGIAIHTITINPEKSVAAGMACLAKATGGSEAQVSDAAGVGTAIANAIATSGLKKGAATAPMADAPAATSDRKPAAALTGPPGLELVAVLNAGGERVDEPVLWRVASAADPSKPVVERLARTLSQDLSPGHYVVEGRVGHIAVKQEVEVGDAVRTAAELDLRAGLLEVAARADDRGTPLSSPLVTLTAEGGDGPLVVSQRSSGSYLLPDGQYRLDVSDGLATRSEALTIKAGIRSKADVVLGTGRLQVYAVAHDGGEPLTGALYTLSVDDPDSPQGRREIARSTAEAPEFVIGAGTYYVTASLGAASTRARIALSSGDIVKNALDLAGAPVDIAVEFDPRLAPPGTPVAWRVLKGDKDPVEIARGTTSPGKTFLPAGTYRIEARLGPAGLRAERPIEVAAGMPITIPIKIETGELTVQPARGSGTSFEVRDTQGLVVLRSTSSEPVSAKLSPGSYVLRAEMGDSRRLLSFEIKPGEQRVLDVSAE